MKLNAKSYNELHGKYIESTNKANDFEDKTHHANFSFKEERRAYNYLQTRPEEVIIVLEGFVPFRDLASSIRKCEMLLLEIFSMKALHLGCKRPTKEPHENLLWRNFKQINLSSMGRICYIVILHDPCCINSSTISLFFKKRQ